MTIIEHFHSVMTNIASRIRAEQFKVRNLIITVAGKFLHHKYIIAPGPPGYAFCKKKPAIKGVYLILPS